MSKKLGYMCQYVNHGCQNRRNISLYQAKVIDLKVVPEEFWIEFELKQVGLLCNFLVEQTKN